MNEWMNNHNWRKKINNVYIMRNHNFAFSAWEIERLKGGLSKYATLVHVDSHLDDSTGAVDIPEILEKINSPEDAVRIAEEYDYTKGESPEPGCIYMRIDNFIWPAIMRNTIGDVIYISDDPSEELNEESLEKIIRNSSSDIFRDDDNEFILNNLLLHIKENNKKIIRYESLEEYEHENKSSLESINGKHKILDLDLDYFNDSVKFNSEPKLRSKEQIIRNLKYLRNLVDWDVITVALSPEFCGGEEACNYLYDIFLECFNIDNNELVDW
ncbi:UPF0489 family protein [Lysinibacillus capsici]|uniref:UPF0489 family protein n=1 Tax=Lysinibacillus capsici TaxID=2115968 RepID=UPI00289ABECA|nr:UPF0489 family protein [Lysinibacillus capsici]